MILYDLLDLAASLVAGGLTEVPSAAGDSRGITSGGACALVFKASEEASASGGEADALLALRFSPKECARLMLYGPMSLCVFWSACAYFSLDVAAFWPAGTRAARCASGDSLTTPPTCCKIYSPPVLRH